MTTDELDRMLTRVEVKGAEMVPVPYGWRSGARLAIRAAAHARGMRVSIRGCGVRAEDGSVAPGFIVERL